MVQKSITLSFTSELDQEVDNIIKFLNSKRITGSISKSKLIRIAVLDFLEKQKKIKQILDENSEIDKTAEEILTEK